MKKIFLLVTLLCGVVFPQEKPNQSGIILSYDETVAFGYNFNLDDSFDLRTSINFRFWTEDGTEKFKYDLNNQFFNDNGTDINYNSLSVGANVLLIYSLIESETGKFYAGLGPRYNYSRITQENSHNADRDYPTGTNGIPQQVFEYNTYSDLLSLDLVLGYEHQISSTVIIFGETIFYVKKSWSESTQYITNPLSSAFPQKVTTENDESGFGHRIGRIGFMISL